MKKISFTNRVWVVRFLLIALFIVLSGVLIQSCQKESPVLFQEESMLKSATVLQNPTLYWGHETFTRNIGKPVVVQKVIGSAELCNYKPDFVLNVKNGDPKNRVSSAIIKIDGNQIFGTSNFSKKVETLSKGISGLTENSILEVELRSSPGSFLEIWIDGEPDNILVDSRDGKTYKTVKIGNQVWMAENLAYDAGDGCWAYNNDENNVATYGRLYTWNVAVIICPSGWHLPTDNEWDILTNYLGGESIAGGKLAETGTEHWISPNLSATNESGFTALPSGGIFQGNFEHLRTDGYWWSSTEYDTTYAWLRMLSIGTFVSRFYHYKNCGFSVRCVKDN